MKAKNPFKFSMTTLAAALSVALTLLQVGVPLSAYADSAVSTASTAEFQLFSSIIALSGENLPKAEVQKQVQADLSQYQKLAPTAGRTERTEQALVSLGVFTPAQAQSFESQIQSATKGLSTSHFASNAAAQKAIQAQVMNIASNAAGAQFSEEDSCGLAVIAGLLDLGASPYEAGTSDELLGVGMTILALDVLYVSMFCD